MRSACSFNRVRRATNGWKICPVGAAVILLIRSSASPIRPAITFREVSPPCRSNARCPSPARVNRSSTTCSAARFSATNKIRLPSAAALTIRLTITWLFPVPGGPWITRL